MKYLLLLVFAFIFQTETAAQKKTFETNGIITSYQTFGVGEPVLIINGGPGMNSDSFGTLARMLSENNTTIIYDQRGTGDSKMQNIDRSNMNIGLLAEDIENLRKHLGYEKWIVLGHSFGGILAYEYAASYPKSVKAMIQSHSGGMSIDVRDDFEVRSKLSRVQLDSLNHYTVKIAMGDSTAATALKRAEFLAAAYLYDDNLAKEIASRLVQVDRMINSYIWMDLQINQFNRSKEMQNFHKPVLILHGEDEVVPLNVAQYAHNILPESKLVVLEECGHYGWIEKPEIYLKEVKDFLKAHSNSRNP